MQIKIYQVDAFANKVFSGNPAAVCPLSKWLDDSTMQKIAMENNLAETAFYVKEGNGFRIRWFTPATEVDLCGHATLATAFVIFNYENYSDSEINFVSRSGILNVRKQYDLFTMNFPTDVYNHVDLSPELTKGFNVKPVEAYKGKTDFMLVFENEAQIKNMKPDFQSIEKLPCRGIIITAKGEKIDFVSRFFAPQSGINEDPVTGSAHTTLTPYWAQKLGKNELTAIQLSPRIGYLKCKYLGERVEISGNAVLYLVGNIEISS
ncbi:MAG TPA: PhzF family phenazine biosynthesis protein [Flavipsychrobacter sp.]|nr:PhzF family phenazine biosynthesis protein [Flavipsychrobacter sp.]